MVREIWWFYTLNPTFFRLEKSGWPEKKIEYAEPLFLNQISQTRFLKPDFKKLQKLSAQNKRVSSELGPKDSEVRGFYADFR